MAPGYGLFLTLAPPTTHKAIQYITLEREKGSGVYTVTIKKRLRVTMKLTRQTNYTEH